MVVVCKITPQIVDGTAALWVVLVRELQVSDFRQFTEISGTGSARN